MSTDGARGLADARADSGAVPVSEEVMEVLVRRVAERMARGERPVALRLPADKAAFPKLLCLDQNQWIYLGQAHANLNGQGERLALRAVRAATANGRLVVPILGANAVEVAEPMDASRRERLATFMVDLSANHSAVNDVPTGLIELRRSTGRHLLGSNSATPVRTSLVHRGIYAAATGHPPVVDAGDEALNAIVNDALMEPEVSVAALAHAVSRDMISSFRKMDVDAARVVEEVRAIDAGLSTAERRLLELRNLLTGGALGETIRDLLVDLKVQPAVFEAWLSSDEHVLALTDETPGIDVMATLMLHRDRNRGHRTHRNDGKDFAFLQVAIPYANIVVTERSWAHLANSSGLAAKYGTVVTGDASELPTLIGEMGCLKP